MAEQLPALPGMLIRAVPTMVSRKRVLQDEPQDLQFSFQLEAFERNHIDKYHAMFPGMVSAIPLTYFYLAAQRAHLAAMLDPNFPWPILGMVHVANKMQQHAPVNESKGFRLTVTIEMPERAATKKRVRPLYRVEFYQGETLVVECLSTYQVGGGEPPARGRRREMPAPDLNGFIDTGLWQLNSELGRQYATLSGDFNPIHLHPWLSRWFGFSRPIIHGMYSVARAQAKLEQELQQAVTVMDVVFRRPLILPAEAHFYYADQDGKFSVTDAKASRAYLDGTFELAKAEKNQEEDVL
ncbi:MAG: acyl dehydratase [Firmicutes bacterium]|nr:acyl dehydratase [Bacillota bacterium]